MDYTLDMLDDLVKAGKVPEKDRQFATDLITKGRRYPSSPRQWHWVGKLIKQAMGIDSARVIGDLVPVYDLFKRAAEYLKHPNIVLQLPDGKPLRLYVSTERSKIPGVVNITQGRGGIWLGRVMTDGKWVPSNQVSDAILDPVEILLKRFAADPAGVAAEYGKLTGLCSFCYRRLADERSTAVGYGPVCATKWGQPWGK